MPHLDFQTTLFNVMKKKIFQVLRKATYRPKICSPWWAPAHSKRLIQWKELASEGTGKLKLLSILKLENLNNYSLWVPLARTFENTEVQVRLLNTEMSCLWKGPKRSWILTSWEINNTAIVKYGKMESFNNALLFLEESLPVSSDWTSKISNLKLLPSMASMPSSETSLLNSCALVLKYTDSISS